MLSRLNDQDISSRWCRQSSGQANSKLEACYLVYIGLAGLSSKTGALNSRGFELSENWVADLHSLERHFDEHLISALDENELAAFHQFALAVVQALVRDPEIIFAYASGEK